MVSNEISTDELNEVISKIRNDVKTRTFFRLLRCSDLINRYNFLKAVELDDSVAQLAVWDFVLRYKGSVNQKDLTKGIFRSKQSISRIIDSLEQKKLIKRKISEDRRERYILLTKKGLNHVLDNIPQRISIGQEVFSEISEQDVKNFLEVLNKLIPILKKQIDGMANKKSI